MKISVCMLLVVCLAGCYDHSSQMSKLEGQALPAFDILLIDSTTKLNTKHIPSGKPIMLFYFDPQCPYCQVETQEIVNHINDFRNTRLFFLTSYPYKELKSFYDKFQLKTYPNIIVGSDFNFFVEKYYQATEVPYIVFYSKDKYLKQVLKGKVNIETIKNVALN